MSIKQRKSKNGEFTFQVSVRDHLGRWFSRRQFRTKSEAKTYESELLVKRSKGAGASDPVLRQLDLSGYWIRWREECRQRVSDGWKQSQDLMFEKHIQPFLGSRLIRDIRSEDIGSVLGQLEHDGYAAQTRLHAYNLLHRMFGDAVEYHELLEKNPVKRKLRPRVLKKERAFLAPEESRRLLAACESKSEGLPVWIALLSGLRVGEVQALRWRDVDFERGRILIRGTYNKKTRTLQTHPKQGDWGQAPLPPDLAKRLKAEWERGSKNETDFVCRAKRNSGMLNYDWYTQHILPKLCAEAGVKRVTFHELRHSCTELWVEMGANQEDLRRLLNHKSGATTLNYMHRTPERLNQIGEQIRVHQTPTPDPTPSPKAISHLRLVSG